MRACFYLILIIMCSTQTTAAMVDAEYSEIYLKRTVLVEERTAIWCPSCAEIDPELELVAEAHGSRIAIVGLHVEDEFENDASLARIEYQMQIDNSTYGTPTFFVDGMKTAEGYDAWQDVQRRILTQENSRTSPEKIPFDLSNEQFNLAIPEIGQITLMVLEHGKQVPEGADNPGLSDRDRVLIGMKVFSSDGNISEYGDLSIPESWSVILIHEPVSGGEPFGVVEISNRVYEDFKDNNLVWILSVCILLGSLAVFWPTANIRITEEE